MLGAIYAIPCGGGLSLARPAGRGQGCCHGRGHEVHLRARQVRYVQRRSIDRRLLRQWVVVRLPSRYDGRLAFQPYVDIVSNCDEVFNDQEPVHTWRCPRWAPAVPPYPILDTDLGVQPRSSTYVMSHVVRVVAARLLAAWVSTAVPGSQLLWAPSLTTHSFTRVA